MTELDQLAQDTTQSVTEVYQATVSEVSEVRGVPVTVRVRTRSGRGVQLVMAGQLGSADVTQVTGS